MFKGLSYKKKTPYVRKRLSYENSDQQTFTWKMETTFPFCLEEDQRNPLKGAGTQTIRTGRAIAGRNSPWSWEAGHGVVTLRIKKERKQGKAVTF